MKIVIAASGGVNSAYCLYQFLANTDHEVVALNHIEGYENAPNERAEFDAMCDWLSTNVRTFERAYVSLPQISSFDDVRPVRVGFERTISYAFLAARYENCAEQIGTLNADALALGISVENTSTDRTPALIGQIHDTGAAVYFPAISITEPIAADADYNALAAQMTGRFEQLEELPAELRPLVNPCDVNTCTDHWCIRCAYQRGYEHFVANGQTGRDFDLWCAEKGSYGQWRSAADPAEYRWRGGCCDDCAVHNYLADLVGRDWPSAIDARNRIAWFTENGADMTGIETEEQLRDFVGRMGRVNLDRGVNSNAMSGDEYWNKILEAALL